MKILNFGSCNLDFVHEVAHFVRAGETIHALSRSVFPGGKGLNQSIALARAGAKVYHAGCVGKDGELLRSLLRENGVEIPFLATVEEATGYALIQVQPDGENSIVLYAGANEQITGEMAEKVLAHFEKGDVLLLQNEISAIPEIAEAAAEKGMRIFYNPAPFSDMSRQADPAKCECLIVNETEGEALTGEQRPAKIAEVFAEKYPGVELVLTCGKRGAYWLFGQTALFQPTFAVESVDTTAAGDTFIGTLIAGICQGKSREDCLKTACAAAAISTEKKGAASSIPTAAEVEERLPLLKPLNGNRDTEEFLDELRSYCRSDPARASLCGFAESIHASRSGAAHKIKRTVGRGFSEFLREIRLEQAAELLKNTDLPIGQVIESVGYQNETYFRRCFEERYGEKPLAFRKQEKGAMSCD